MLIGDAGLNAVVVHNQAKQITVSPNGERPTITAESGTIFAAVARQAAEYSLTGLEWASTVPGTVGGAVYGNADFGSTTKDNLIAAELLHRDKGVTELLSSEDMAYAYRSSALKTRSG